MCKMPAFIREAVALVVLRFERQGVLGELGLGREANSGLKLYYTEISLKIGGKRTSEYLDVRCTGVLAVVVVRSQMANTCNMHLPRRNNRWRVNTENKRKL